MQPIGSGLPRRDPQRLRAVDFRGARRRIQAAVRVDRFVGLAVDDADVHRQVRAVDHRDVVEVEPGEGVEVPLGERRRNFPPSPALVAAVAVAGRAAALAAAEVAAGPSPDPRVPAVRDLKVVPAPGGSLQPVCPVLEPGHAAGQIGASVLLIMKIVWPPAADAAGTAGADGRADRGEDGGDDREPSQGSSKG